MSKQSSLFSFFSSKPVGKPPPQTKLSQATSQEPSSKATPPKGKPQAQATPSATSGLKVGSEIEVYWPDDAEYYACTVIAHLKNNKWKVEYGDGQAETVDLGEQEWKLASKNAIRRAPKGGGSGDEAEFDDDAMDEESFKGDEESSSEEEVRVSRGEATSL